MSRENEGRRISQPLDFLLGGAQNLLRGAQHLGEEVVENAQHLFSEKWTGESRKNLLATSEANATAKQKSQEIQGRDTIIIDTAKDQARAAFLEAFFVEYALGKREKNKKTSMSDTKYGDKMFEEFLKTSELKCSNVRHILRLIQTMKRNKVTEEEEMERKDEYSSDEDD